MKKTVTLLFIFFILLVILYFINHSSNKTISKNATIDLIKYKVGLQKMLILCETLVSENNATEVCLDYRNGQTLFAFVGVAKKTRRGLVFSPTA